MPPPTRKSVVDYEIGSKLALLDHKMQLNGALFHYDYSDKQVLGTIIDPLFGPAPILVNIPKSSVDGAEFEVSYIPVTDLVLHVAATYLDTKVSGHFVTNDVLGICMTLEAKLFPIRLSGPFKLT